MSGDEVVRVLHVAPRDVVTALVRRGGALCVARYYATPVPRALDAAVAAHLLGQQACAELPPALAARLAGYRVRASLGPLAGVPTVVAGGVRRMKLQGLAPLAGVYGNAYVTVSAYAGTPLPEVVASLEPEARRALLAAIIPIVAGLHARGVAHGQLRAGAFAAAGTTVTLIELEPLRAAGAEAFAVDREAIAQLAAGLLGAAPAPATLAALWDRSAAEPAVDATVMVTDEGGEGTVYVPDD